MAAANVFIACADACVDQVEYLLNQDHISEGDKMQLAEHRRILRAYCKEALQKNNRSGNAAGFDRVYRNMHKQLHSQIKRSATDHSGAKFEALIAEIEQDRLNAASRKHPAIEQALQIIVSPDVGNHRRAELVKLQKRTPKEHQHIWRELWVEFQERALTVARSNTGE